MYDVSSDTKRSMRVRDVVCILSVGVLIFAIGVVGGILIGIYAYHGGPSSSDSKDCAMRSDQSAASSPIPTPSTPILTTTSSVPLNVCSTCSKRNPILPVTGPEIFAPLTEDEIIMIREYLIKEGLVSSKPAFSISIKDNYIAFMELSTANKTDILNYLDNNGPYPGRYARVFVVRGARSDPDCMMYEVGPIGEGMAAVQLYNDGDIAFETRPIDDVEFALYRDILRPVEIALENLTMDSFGGAKFGDGKLFWFRNNDPPGKLEHERETKINAFFNPFGDRGDLNTLDMLPLSAAMHCPGNDPSTWYVHSLYYLNQGPYNSTDELMADYNSDKLRKVKLPADYKDSVYKYAYLGRDESKPMRDKADMHTPRTYEPMGPRYTLQGHHVTWMGWEFDVTSRTMRGPALFDLRYKGERISYEIALNDICLIYAGDSFERSNVIYTDATYGIGYYMDTMRSIDCPRHATTLNTTFYFAQFGIAYTVKSICVFEEDAEEASWRHWSPSFQGGMRRSNLIVRFSAPIANYDYIVDFEFRLDGKMYTRVKATGYIQTSFWYQENPNRENSQDDTRDARDPFGYKVADYAHGLIHDHMFGFKVDMDVLGSNNSFEVIHFNSGDTLDAFKSQDPSMTKAPHYFTFDKTRYLQYETVENETGYRLNLEAPKLWTVVNENHRNHWGAKRGYQIVPLNTALQTMVESHPAIKALSFSKYTCAVTKRRDSEPFLTSLLDGFRLDNPREDLDSKLNNESIRNEDLVTWVSVGFHHVPSSEDYPMTVALETGFLLKPFNFFDRTNVFDMPQYFKSPDGTVETPPTPEPCLEPIV